MQRQAAVNSMGLRLRVGSVYWTVRIKVNFAGHIVGTVEPRWTIHASRQLSDKVLRYLKGHSYPRCLLVLR